MKVLGGRDVLGGGTWMGCTKDGRLAFLTNVLEPDAMPGARTRGDLPLRFLQVYAAKPIKSFFRSFKFVCVFILWSGQCRTYLQKERYISFRSGTT